MSEWIQVAGIVKETIVDGPGIRLTVYAQGCNHGCPGCHNPATHSFAGGERMPVENILQMLDANPLLDGITLSGGDPFEQARSFAFLARKVKEKGLHVMTYTGYTFEQLWDKRSRRPEWERLLRYTDLLVDGRFELSQRNGLLKFRGSENQRIIDVGQSIQTGKAVTAPGFDSRIPVTV